MTQKSKLQAIKMPGETGTASHRRIRPSRVVLFGSLLPALLISLTACASGSSSSGASSPASESVVSTPEVIALDEWIVGNWTCSVQDHWTQDIVVSKDGTWTMASEPGDGEFQGSWVYRAGAITFATDSDSDPIDGGGLMVSGLPEILQLPGNLPLVQTFQYAKSVRGDVTPGSATGELTATTLKFKYTDATYSSNDFDVDCKRS